MQVLLVANAELRSELLNGVVDQNVSITWITDPDEYNADKTFDACIDLLFQKRHGRISWLKSLDASLIVVNAVIPVLDEIDMDFVRINGWLTLLARPVIEAAAANENSRQKAGQLFSALGKKTEWVPDIPGFLTARVIASIINEAYFALEEKVSTQEEIDIAMKSGTNYPWGPFEWSKKIGLADICALLESLSSKQPRYAASQSLRKISME